jgi:hypothetical protein
LSRLMQMRQESLPKMVRGLLPGRPRRGCARAIADNGRWQAPVLITTAIAREMAAFLWAVGHEVPPHRAVGPEHPLGRIRSTETTRGGIDQLGLTSAVAQCRRQGLSGEPSYELCGR